MVLTDSVWPGWRVWTTDPDRSLSPDKLGLLSEQSGVSIDEIEKTFFNRLISRHSRAALPTNGVWPWMVAHGKRNRTGRMGQPFCPRCFAEDPEPFCRRSWRLAWFTVCPHHCVKLQDFCLDCNSPIQPWRLIAQDRSLARCFHCQADLAEQPAQLALQNDLRFGTLASETLDRESGIVWGQTVMCAEWFDVASLFSSWLRLAATHPRSHMASLLTELQPALNFERIPYSGLSLEKSAISERHELLRQVSALLTLDPVLVRQKFLQLKTGSSAFLRRGKSTPPCILPFIQAHSQSRKARKPAKLHSSLIKPKSKRSVMAAWARLQRKFSRM